MLCVGLCILSNLKGKSFPTVNPKQMLLIRNVCWCAFRTRSMTGTSIIVKTQGPQSNDCIWHSEDDKRWTEKTNCRWMYSNGMNQLGVYDDAWNCCNNCES